MSINRIKVIKRHDVVISELDPLSPLTVGNGEFAFTVDVTGLQSLPAIYRDGIHLGTQSQWGWHTEPNPNNYQLSDTFVYFENSRGQFPYAKVVLDPETMPPGTKWLRENPHRMQLGTIGFVYRRDNSSPYRQLDPGCISNIRQSLDLTTGAISSEVTIDDYPVRVVTVCHPDVDMIAVRIESPLVVQGRLAINVAFTDDAELSTTNIEHLGDHTNYARAIHEDRYYVSIQSAGHTVCVSDRPHEYQIELPTNPTVEFLARFGQQPAEAVGDFESTLSASEQSWSDYWLSGAFVDFEGSAHPRASELERRIILSQYLTRTQCCGSLPPQETGLTMNSWHGKFHLEMHWWHAAHFAMWGRPELIERSLPYYDRILPKAQETARIYGCTGARWPKMTGPSGRETPSPIGPFLLWQQPHPIHYAELIYKLRPTRETLEKYSLIVLETAEFMASFAIKSEGRFVLGPPSIPAQECYKPAGTINPTFELAYWWWGIDVAQQWLTRQGLSRREDWDEVLNGLSRPHVHNGVYAAIETEPFLRRDDHPSMLMGLGFLPKTPIIDETIMNDTFDDVMGNWNWPTTWGWDFPVLSMTASRLDRPVDAIEALLMDVPKNRFLANGHNFLSYRLPIYLPGNGALLAAVAIMANDLPKEGEWRIVAEGFPARL